MIPQYFVNDINTHIIALLSFCQFLIEGFSAFISISTDVIKFILYHHQVVNYVPQFTIKSVILSYKYVITLKLTYMPIVKAIDIHKAEGNSLYWSTKPVPAGIKHTTFLTHSLSSERPLP